MTQSVTPLVLIVDDDERNGSSRATCSRPPGSSTLEAATGEEAIALAREHLPDLVLMDLRLPD